MARVVSRTFLLFLPTAVFVLTLHRDTVDIDLHSGVVRGYSRYVTFVEPPSHERRERCARQAVVRIDFSGPYKIAKFLLEYDRPRLWTLHIADSHGSDGHGGDNVNATSNMAALHVFNRQMRIYSNSLPGYLGATIDGGLLLKVVDNIARRGSKLQLQVSNEKLEWTQGKQREVLESRFLFTLSGQQPVFGTADYDLFASFNRIIAGNWRNGSGLCRATIIMLREEDECILGTHECDTNAICRNTKKSYRCTCKTGYEGDGKRCEDKDECKVRNGGCVHRCHNSPGNYSCSCYEGFHLDKDGHNCIDVNECLVSKGGCAHHCVNTMGSYECRCNEGYNIGSDGRSCVVGSWCREQGCGHTCELTRSSYICTCRPGYILTKDGKNCMQTCSLGNGGCQHRCTNTPDGPVCTCHYKYILGLDKKSCSPSCSVNNGGCDRRCSTTPQGAVKCSCPNGFIIHKDGRTCLDIDECEAKNGGCSYKCQNNIGSYECICPKGFKLLPDEKTCTEFDECSINGTCDHICINLPGSYECQCHQGYERYGLTHCGDKNECTVNNGGCSHICENTPGSFRCLCPEGFHLHLNKRDCIESDSCRDSTARIQLKCTWNNSQEHCGATCNSNGYLTTNGNESYSFTCGSHNYGTGRGLCTETGVGAPCFEAADSPAIRRHIRFYFMTEKCNLIKKNFLSISTAFRKNVCLSLGHITYMKIECAPYQRHRYYRDTISTTPIPKPDPSSVIKLELDLQVDYERSTDKCDYQCVRRKGERKLKQVINHVRLIISNEKFFFVSDGSLYEIIRRNQKHSENQTFCNDDQFFIHEKCVTCNLGSYYNMEHARCLPCPSGTYQDEDGQLGCNICPLDRSWSNRDVMGAKNISQCGAQCNPGSFSSDGFEPCTLCMKGTFQPESGRTSCIPCGRGVNTKTTGASSFRDCLVKDSCSSGYFFDTSLAQCVICPRGTYQPLMGQNFCVNCPGNTTTDFEGAKDVSECKSIDCGGYVGKLLGIFESPNFPGNYPNNIECTWVIHPEKGRRILVVVPEVYLANDKCGDYVVMRKSRSPYSVTTYETCKTQDRPIAFTARSRKLWIQFKADSKNNGRGFRIPYALFNEEYQPLIESIVRDSQLYAMINHQEILKDRKLLTALMDVIAHPINYYKYANISRAWFPDSFIRFIMSKVKIFFS